jgi:hypothetical protein
MGAKFKVGDRVRQNDTGVYKVAVPGLIGTVVEVDEEGDQTLYPVAVNFPQIDSDVWHFNEPELDLVTDEEVA